MKKDNRNQNVVRFFLKEIIAVILKIFGKDGVKVEWTVPAFFTVEGTAEIISQVIEHIQEHYFPQIGIRMESDTLIQVYRDKSFTLAGDTVSASAQDTGNGRKRINSGLYKWIHGQTIERNFNRPCEAKHSWIVKDSSGNIMTYSDTLRNAWGYLEMNFPL